MIERFSEFRTEVEISNLNTGKEEFFLFFSLFPFLIAFFFLFLFRIKILAVH
jgi:hypothetical protein